MIRTIKKIWRIAYLVNRSKKRRKLQNHILNRFEETRSVFIHIPKTAGISVTKALYGEDVIGGGHANAALMKWKVGPLNWHRYFKFTFVRHPYDRIKSAYFYLKSGGRGPWDQAWADQYLSDVHSFEEFIESWLSMDNIHKGQHFIPQYQFIFKKNKLLVDFIGKFETIEEDFETVKLKVNKKAVLTKRNITSNKKGIKEISNRKLEDKIYSIYKEDYLRFGYKRSY